MYVWETGDRVAFASDLNALSLADGFPREVDQAAVAAYLQLGFVPAPLTIYEGVRKLEPGEWRRYGATGTGVGTIVPDGPMVTSTPDVEALLEVLTDAVAIRTVADVPVGVFLSGGIDSTLVAALAARAGSVRTFTAVFDQRSHDESRHAARVARALGTDHHELAISAADGIAVAQGLPRQYGEPFGDPSAVPTHLVARAAREHVTVVALTGDGGDELFAGYNRLVAGAGAWTGSEVGCPPRSAARSAAVWAGSRPRSLDRCRRPVQCASAAPDHPIHRREAAQGRECARRPPARRPRCWPS